MSKISAIDGLKAKIAAEQVKRQSLRDANPDKETCDGCTYKDTHSISCTGCARDIRQKIKEAQVKIETARDNWLDGKVYPPSFDDGWPEG